jgi:hypothetical protein
VNFFSKWLHREEAISYSYWDKNLLQENWKLGFFKKRILKRQLKFNRHVTRFKQSHIIYLFWDWFWVAKDCDLHRLGIALSIRWPSFGGIFYKKNFEKKFTLLKWIQKFNYHIQWLRLFLNIFLGSNFLSLKVNNCPSLSIKQLSFNHKKKKKIINNLDHWNGDQNSIITFQLSSFLKNISIFLKANSWFLQDYN